ncbi:MAG: hypothetical protein AAF938_11585, partial [Myxococcota bacterium]
VRLDGTDGVNAFGRAETERVMVSSVGRITDGERGSERIPIVCPEPGSCFFRNSRGSFELSFGTVESAASTVRLPDANQRIFEEFRGDLLVLSQTGVDWTLSRYDRELSLTTWSGIASISDLPELVCNEVSCVIAGRNFRGAYRRTHVFDGVTVEMDVAELLALEDLEFPDLWSRGELGFWLSVVDQNTRRSVLYALDSRLEGLTLVASEFRNGFSLPAGSFTYTVDPTTGAREVIRPDLTILPMPEDAPFFDGTWVCRTATCMDIEVDRSSPLSAVQLLVRFDENALKTERWIVHRRTLRTVRPAVALDSDGGAAVFVQRDTLFFTNRFRRFDFGLLDEQGVPVGEPLELAVLRPFSGEILEQSGGLAFSRDRFVAAFGSRVGTIDPADVGGAGEPGTTGNIVAAVAATEFGVIAAQLVEGEFVIRELNVSGAPIAEPIATGIRVGRSEYDVEIAYGPSGTLLVASVVDLRDRDIRAVRVSPSGDLVDSTPIPVSSADNAELRPSIAADADGFHLVWSDSRDSPTTAIRYAFIPAEGRWVEEDATTLFAGETVLENASITLDQGTLFVEYVERNDSGQRMRVRTFQGATETGSVFDVVSTDLRSRSIEHDLVARGGRILSVFTLPDEDGSAQVYSTVITNDLDGAACADASECASGNCVMGVCCDNPCDGSCETCRAVEGAERDGQCGVRPSTSLCRPSTDACDAEEFCDGESPACPAELPPPLECVDAGMDAGQEGGVVDASVVDAGFSDGAVVDASIDASDVRDGAVDASATRDLGPSDVGVEPNRDAAVGGDASTSDGGGGCSASNAGSSGFVGGLFLLWLVRRRDSPLDRLRQA